MLDLLVFVLDGLSMSTADEWEVQMKDEHAEKDDWINERMSDPFVEFGDEPELHLQVGSSFFSRDVA